MLDFSNIDAAIQYFRKGKHGIYVSEKARSDWFIFQYRSIEWKKGNLAYVIEIFPDLDDAGNSISWNYIAMIHFDENNRRHIAKYDFIRAAGFAVVEKVVLTLEEKYNYLNSLEEAEIDFKNIPLSQGL